MDGLSLKNQRSHLFINVVEFRLRKIEAFSGFAQRGLVLLLGIEGIIAILFQRTAIDIRTSGADIGRVIQFITVLFRVH